MRYRLLLGFILCLALGCGSAKFAPVTGTVTLNGKPLADAAVSFQPEVPTGSTETLPESVGKTDENGKYTLKATRGEQEGAVVGKHKVIITPAQQLPAGMTGDERRLRNAPPAQRVLPPAYNTETVLTFEVLPGRTNQADFDLKAGQ